MLEFGTLKFRVALSCSRHDQAWGRWLRGALEAYPIDRELVGRRTCAGPVPKTLRPIFDTRARYRRDLREVDAAGDALTDETLAALRASQFLIVLCSPAAAKCPHVNEDIRHFNAMRRADRVIAVIVGGEPGDREQDCFPPALRLRLGPDRRPTDEIGRPIANARPEGGGRTRALHQVAARLFGLELDDIERRAGRARSRRFIVRAAALAGLVALPLAWHGGMAGLRHELARNEPLLDDALRHTHALTTAAVDLSRQFGLPRGLSAGMLAPAENMFRAMAELGRETPRLRQRKAAMLIGLARHHAALGDQETPHARATEAEGLLARLTAEAAGNVALQHDLARVHDDLGDVLNALGRRREALASYRSGVIIAEHLAAGHNGVLRLHEKIGDVLRARGEIDAALASYGIGRALAEDLLVAEPGNGEWQRALSVSHVKIGDMLALQDRLEAALASYRIGNAIAERLAAAEPGDAARQKDLAISHERIGTVLEAQGDLAAALEAYRIGLAIAGRLAAARPGDSAWQRDLAVAHEHIGDVRRALGDLAGALKDYETKRAIVGRLLASDPGNAGWQYDLGVSHARIGLILESRGNFAAALKEYEACLDIGRRFAAADPGNAGWQRDLAVSYGKLAAVHHRLGRAGLALSELRKGREIIAALVKTAPEFEHWSNDLARFDTQIAALEGRAPERRAGRPCAGDCADQQAGSLSPVVLAGNLRDRVKSAPPRVSGISN